MSFNTCIYVLLENRRRVRYIGITALRPEQRLLQHYAESDKSISTHKTNWIRRCLAEEIPITIRVVKSGLSRQRAEQLETRLIRFFGKSFNLVNSRNARVFTQSEPRRFNLEIGIRRKGSDEVVWTDLRSVRNARKWLNEIVKSHGPVSQKFYR